ncbi:MAG: 3-phosphoshikimate 1-carboxyvinyltransferase [Candidatus Gygaella obscura]|nr:3-phosphoshikimate 1-carboxyvinyltransferase [Candidatus Gygaella obscura]
MPVLIPKLKKLRGTVTFPGDKSIAHRAIIISSIAKGRCVIEHFPFNNDCLTTLEIFKLLGVKIKVIKNKEKIIVYGRGIGNLKKPQKSLYCKSSGTTIRLLAGILSAQRFNSSLTASKTLSKRPMLRITRPLRLMSADIKGKLRQKEEYPPLKIKGKSLKGIYYKLPIASAQIKSAIFLAGIYASGKTTVEEVFASRDHTERMLKIFKARLTRKNRKITIHKVKELIAVKSLFIPGDISSAAFFIVASCILPGSRIKVRNLGINPTRSGIIKVLKRMGADIEITRKNDKVEPVADLDVCYSPLKATKIKVKEIPLLIDEVPILMVAACFAKGTTIIEGVNELRVKETDRVRSMVDNLIKMAADIKIVRKNKRQDLVIRGVRNLKSASLKSFQDHRTAMSLIIASLGLSKAARIDNLSCINKSFPEFFKILKKLKS